MGWRIVVLVIVGCGDDAANRDGCADGSREGFALAVYADIAACAGAWQVPGLRDVEPACGRNAGNDGSQTGAGCSAQDLCADGWHLCQSALEVADHLPADVRSCAGLDADAEMFFATAQSGAGGNCRDDATDDFAGCGTYGETALPSCAPLDRTTNNMCTELGAGGWLCPQNRNEVNTVIKTEPLRGGGVLCCRD